ncbi:MAG: uncharacterized protein JWO56_3693 [Acidobacteria bacterium]|nr:uncharacterized protein [Acidobacteriota bacterium]
MTMTTYVRPLLLLAASWLVVLSGAARAAVVPEQPAELREVARIPELRAIRKVIFSRRQPSQYYLLDRDRHSVSAVSAGGVRLIGDIGNGPGELYYPFDLALTADDRLYVKDGGNKRIEIFGADGRYVGQLPDKPKSEGLAVNAYGEVFIGQPATGHLISVYGSSGKKLTAFGDLLTPSTVYGPPLKGKDSAYRASMNRVRIAVDDQDNVWVAFLHAPIVCKFNRNGKLLAKTTLQLPSMSLLTEAVLQQPPPKKYMSQDMDGLPLTLVIKEIVIDHKNRQTLLLLGDDRIVCLRPDASPEKIIRIPSGRTLATLAADSDGAIFTSQYSTGQVFRVVPQKTKTEREISK